MTLYLDCTIKHSSAFHCTLRCEDDRTLNSPVLCFSIQVPVRIVSGGRKIEGLGGFTALRLDGQLTRDTPLHFTVTFEDPSYVATNRAWFPQGPYVRHENGTEAVQTHAAVGVHHSLPPDRQMPASGLALIPAPQSWLPDVGIMDTPDFDISGAFPSAISAIDGLALRRGFRQLSGGIKPLTITKDKSLAPDAYRLEIGESVALRAGNRGGAFYGLVTLLMLRETQAGLPKGTITDGPRFEWRGFMLDCAREFYSVEDILKLLDLMACLKLNRFHWHFADDEAFRLQLIAAPELAATAFRGEGQVIPSVFGGRPGPVGGTYSHDDVGHIVAHAKALNIEILPEIEVPAHAMALTTIRPDLRDPDDTGTETSVQGYPRNVVNPERSETWALLEPMALEVAKLFPFGHVHLGGDELPEMTWAGSPLADAYKARHGLTTSQDVLGHMMHRLGSGLRDAEITPCAWQEAAFGHPSGIGNDAVLFSWTGAGPGRAAARRGHRVVMCPAQHTYFDMAHTADFDDWGANWAANYDLDKAFDWDPIPAADVADQIIGVEGTFWSEFTSTAREYEAMIAPRILALATKAWSTPTATDLANLRAAATCHAAFFETMDWQVNWASVYRDTPPGQVRRVDA